MEAMLRETVFKFIEKQLHCKSYEIALDRSLNIDFGMDGDDAVEFFVAFSEKFEVDITDLEAEWPRYFGPEASLLTVFNARSFRPELPLRISQIVKAAEVGRWQKLPNNIEA